MANPATFEVRQTEVFAAWLRSLRDEMAATAVTRRIARLRVGLVGDAKSVGDGVSELRVDVGPGYRVYFTRRERMIVILLCGGDKGSQKRDIERAKLLAQEV